MGYTIIIGEKIKNPNFDELLKDGEEDGYDLNYFRNEEYVAKTETSKDSPAFGEPTDFMNQRWPSYTSWAAFLYTSGLNDIFFDNNDNLIGGHPGYFEITDDIYQKINDKYTRFKMQNKGAIASFEDDDLEKFDKIIYFKDYKIPVNHTLARFQWFIYWLEKSKKNYDSVVISNT